MAGLLIGLSGYARSGKDTVGQILFQNADFERTAWADTLREALYRLNPIVSMFERADGEFSNQGSSDYVWLKDLVDTCGWDEAKSASPEIRTYLQRLGTEVGREMFGENFWVDQTFRRYDPENGGHFGLKQNLVITDCRFPSEYYAIKQRQGYVWRIERKGVGPANDHVSEVGLDGFPFDAIVPNNWGVEELEEIVLNNLKAEPYRRYLI